MAATWLSHRYRRTSPRRGRCPESSRGAPSGPAAPGVGWYTRPQSRCVTAECPRRGTPRPPAVGPPPGPRRCRPSMCPGRRGGRRPRRSGACRAAPAPAGDPPPGPMVDGVAASRGDVFFGGAVVEHVRAVADVTQRVPLARPLRVEVVEDVIEAQRAGNVQHLVARNPSAGCQGRREGVQGRVQGEQRAPRTSLAASRTRSAVSRLRRPRLSSGPNRPHAYGPRRGRAAGRRS